MNKLFHLILTDIKLLSKSKIFYLKLILFPSTLILLLGVIFGNTGKNHTAFRVAFYSEDNVVNCKTEQICLGETFLNLLKSQDIQKLFTITAVSDYEEGEALVNNKKAAVFIYVPKNFSQSYVNNISCSINLIADNTKQIDKQIVKNITDRFIRHMEFIRLEKTEGTDKLTINDSPEYKLTRISSNTNAKPLNPMQYESIAMIVMFSILTAFELAHSIVDDKLNNTKLRIKSTPTSNSLYALGKVAGIVLAIVVQMSIVMIISHLVFHVEFGKIVYLLITTICYGFAIGSIVFCAGTAANDHMAISSFASLILYGFSFLGGSFVEKDSLPDSLQVIQRLIPNGKAINCYLKICQGRNITYIYGDLMALIFIGILFFSIGLYLYGERRFKKDADDSNNKKAAKAFV